MRLQSIVDGLLSLLKLALSTRTRRDLGCSLHRFYCMKRIAVLCPLQLSLRVLAVYTAGMQKFQLGINLPRSSNPDTIRQNLTRFVKAGFDSVEFSLDLAPLIIAGEIKQQWLDFLRLLLAEFSLRYTGHIGRSVDLRDLERYELQKKVLFASIDVCSRLGVNSLVLHYELQSRDASEETKFFEAHVAAADYAATLDIDLCIENIEVERIEPVVDFVNRVARPNFRMCFDTGHAWLASKYFHFDFFESLRAALPVLAHVHLSDNYGIFEELRITDRAAYDSLPKGYRMSFGRGDIHVPPFWGNIPFEDVFLLLKDYSGVYVCEYASSFFLPFDAQIQQSVRSAIDQARS